MILRRILPSLLLLPAASLAAQAAPDTDIHVAELRLGPGTIELGPAINATDRSGYDNQPWFTPDGTGFWYVRMEGGQTDIFLRDLESDAATRVTDTPWGEFSPSPSEDGEELYAVGGGGPDRMGLWRYSMTTGEPLGPLTDPLPNAGYYGVANDTLMFVWINDGAGTLAHVDRRDGTITPFRDRTAPLPPKRIPGETAMSFTEPDYTGQMWIMRLDPETLEVTSITPTVGEGWDFVWLPDGRILMADGEAIFIHDPAGEPGWTEVARFPGVGTITRFALSPRGTHLAFVAEAR